MAFLRDLFVCMMLAPLLVRWPERRLILLATMTAVWAIFGLLVPLLLRPAILLFFIAGILARRGGIELRVASLPFRSEEHTSELQSLMRISYAVFCLKTQTRPNTTSHIEPLHNPYTLK